MDKWTMNLIFDFRILASKIVIFWLFLFLKESLVATFSEKRANISGKYLTGQGMGVAKWRENHNFFWLHFYVFVLEFYPQKL